MVTLNLGGLTIEAYSVGGIETCYQIPAFDVCLDIGRCPPGAERRNVLLLTHAHIDHAAGLPYYVSLRSLINMPPPKVFCPAPDRDNLQAILDGWSKLQADSNRCQLIGVAPDNEIRLPRGHVAQPYRSPHRIATVGYTIYSERKKLKAELHGLDGPAIAERARSGESVNEVHRRAELSFPGDTRIEVVETEPSVTQARILLLECTFVGPDVSIEKARRSGHVHLDQIAERADLFENEHVVLTHFSRRHSEAHIKDEVERRLPAKLLERVHLCYCIPSKITCLLPNRMDNEPAKRNDLRSQIGYRLTREGLAFAGRHGLRRKIEFVAL